MRRTFMDKEYQSLQLTKQEKDAIEEYSGMLHEIINNILEPGVGNEKAFLKKSSLLEYDSRTIQRAIKTITYLYSALYKNVINEGDFKQHYCSYRGTTVEDVERLKNNGQAYRFTSITSDENMAEGYFSINWDNPAVMDISIGKGIPYLYVKQALGEEYGDNWEREIILAPFLNLSRFDERQYKRPVRKSNGICYPRYYSVKLEKQELIEISADEEKELEEYLVKTAEEQYLRIIKILTCTEEIYSKQEVLKNQLRYANEELRDARSEEERKIARKDLEAIKEALEELAKEDNEKREESEKLLEQVNEWKAKMRTLCMSRCRRIEIEIDRQVQEEENIFQEEHKKEQEKRRREYEQKYRDEADFNISEMKLQSEKMIQITRKSN